MPESTQDTQRVRRSRHTPAHGRYGHAVRFYGPDSPEAQAARIEVAEIKAERLVRDLVSSAPPISAAARRRLAAILATAEDTADGVA